jgi:ribosome-associated protein
VKRIESLPFFEFQAMPNAQDTPASDADSASDAFFDRPSKTRRKQNSHDLQDLGVAAVALPDNVLADLPIAEVLLDAIKQFKVTRSHEGRRRQMQYVGKLMRIHDVEPLKQAVGNSSMGRAQDSLALHQTERWRAELLASDEAFTQWAAQYPQSDLQHLRSLIRAARKDAALPLEKRNPKAFREIFQMLKQQVGVSVDE